MHDVDGRQFSQRGCGHRRSFYAQTFPFSGRVRETAERHARMRPLNAHSTGVLGPGVRIQLHSLSRTELNGAFGEIVGRSVEDRSGAERFPVRIAGAHADLVAGAIKVKAINLRDAWVITDLMCQPLACDEERPSMIIRLGNDPNLLRSIMKAVFVLPYPVMLHDGSTRLKAFLSEMLCDLASLQLTCTELRAAAAPQLHQPPNPFALLDPRSVVLHLACLSDETGGLAAALKLERDKHRRSSPGVVMEPFAVIPKQVLQLCLEQCKYMLWSSSDATRADMAAAGLLSYLERLMPLVPHAAEALALYCIATLKSYTTRQAERYAATGAFDATGGELVRTTVARTRKAITDVLDNYRSLDKGVIVNACVALELLFSEPRFLMDEDQDAEDREREKLMQPLLNTLSGMRDSDEIATAVAMAILAFINCGGKDHVMRLAAASPGRSLLRPPGHLALAQPEMYGADTYVGQQGSLLTERRLIYAELHERETQNPFTGQSMSSCPNGVLQAVLNKCVMSQTVEAWSNKEMLNGREPLDEKALDLPELIAAIYRRSFELLDMRGRVYHFPYLYASTHRYAPLCNMTWLLIAAARAEPTRPIVAEAPLAFVAMMAMLPWQLDTQVNYKHSDKPLIKTIDNWLGDSDGILGTKSKAAAAAVALMRRANELIGRDGLAWTSAPKDKALMAINGYACGYVACALTHVITLPSFYRAAGRRKEVMQEGAALIAEMSADVDQVRGIPQSAVKVLHVMASYMASLLASNSSHRDTLTAAGVAEAALQSFDFSDTDSLDERSGLCLSRVRYHLAAMYKRGGGDFLVSFDPREL